MVQLTFKILSVESISNFIPITSKKVCSKKYILNDPIQVDPQSKF